MIGKIKGLIQKNKQNQFEMIGLLKEIEWAHVYHDSIRGKKWLENLSLNIGRWAGNYAFFYVLNRILNDYRPSEILEFGLGESTKFISKYIENELLETNHLVFEQDETWKSSFNKKFELSNRVTINILPVEKRDVKGFLSNSYQELDKAITKKFDLYIIDGPIGSDHYSRYDIVEIAKKFEEKDEFIIIMDDYNRKGEQETVDDLLQLLESKNIMPYKRVYRGNKSLLVIVTEKYKYITSL